MRSSHFVAVLVVLSLMAASVWGDDPRATGDEVRRSVDRSLPYLKRGGEAWIAERGCASCHHVPFLLWTHNEAQQRGFAVDAKTLQGWTNWALVNMLARGKEDGGGLETLTQVLLGRDRGSAWRQKPPRHNKTVDPYETLWEFLLEKQKPGGSFPSEGQRGFPEDISTSWALLALASRDSVKAPKDVAEGLKQNGFGPAMTGQLQRLEKKISEGQERALTWLKNAKPSDSTDAVLLRMLVAAKFDRERVETIKTELLARRKPDGGWAYENDGKESDAFATGQALFALRVVGVKADDPAIVDACRFLLKSQRPDGSWFVPSHSIHNEEVSADYLKRTDEIYSYWGTAWATIGMLYAL